MEATLTGRRGPAALQRRASWRLAASKRLAEKRLAETMLAKAERLTKRRLAVTTNAGEATKVYLVAAAI